MKRRGSFAIYLEPWHGDIFEFLDLKKNHGKEELRARDLFYAIWMCDLFMQRVELDLDWSLMCPNECPGLDDVYGEAFIELYEKYETDGKFLRKVKARDVWYKILEAQMETGTPYILYKDSCNAKSNQKNIAVLKTANLCAEILEVVSGEEDIDPETGIEGQTAVCNLASICLPKFVKGKKNMKFDFDKLYDVAYQAMINLDKVIDINYYPTERAKRSNFSTRPVGLGTQGLADVFFLMNMPFTSKEAKILNKNIFETIYYAAMRASCDMAKKYGKYPKFDGSPASKGILQFDMWNVEPSSRYDWSLLKNEIIENGLRNSLSTCSMPTASTASIFGNEASQEVITSNMYTRKVLSGEFIIVNKHLVKLLCDKGIWNNDIRDKIIINNGSIQNITEIPLEIREIYKTVWETSQKDIIDMYVDRGAFIDQTQSMNIFMSNPNFAKLTSMHFYGWGGGVTKNDKLVRTDGKPAFGSTPERALKTGIYYLRTQAASDAVKFTVEQKVEYTVDEQVSCSLDSPDDCIACSS